MKFFDLEQGTEKEPILGFGQLVYLVLQVLLRF